MRFFELCIFTTSAGIEVLTGVLGELGVTGFAVNDPLEFERFLNGEQTRWDYVEEALLELKGATPSITFYLPENGQGERQLAEIEQALESLRRSDTQGLFGPLSLRKSSVDEEDWANSWKEYFKPFRVGDRLYIKPSWEELADPEGRIVLEIDPASSFGTGTHHTTKLCLLQLERLKVEEARVLDMGCGSGILGIAAMLLGAGSVTAVDIDESSVKTAGENAQKNKIDPARFHLLCGDVTGNTALAEQVGGGYTIVLANIVADVIIGMRKELYGFLSPGGTLIASGIIKERADEVRKALEAQGFVGFRCDEEEEWVALCCTRPA